ncbi:MAG: anti-sigma factor RsiW [Planctomycetota bacterium]|jgi:anti-sigma factor RsiW
MKRDSNDTSPETPSGGQAGSDPQNEMHGHDEHSRDGSPAGAPSDDLVHGLESWSSDDFEAALPLYVGGELKSAEVKRVDAWLASHPEAQKTLAASEAAAGVLARFAQITHQRETPDLWAGIRSELVEQRLIMDLAAPTASHEQAPIPLAPILGGPRWFQRKSVAAAAGLLLAGSIGVSMMARSTTADRVTVDGTGDSLTAPGQPASLVGSAAVAGVSPSGSAKAGLPNKAAGPEPGMRLVSNGAPLVAVMGTDERPISAMAVGSRHVPAESFAGSHAGSHAEIHVGGKTQRLQPAGPNAQRLIDEAPNGWFWQLDPLVETSLFQPGVGTEAQLTSGR